MRILVVAATRREIPLLDSGRHGAHDIDVLVTGVGMVATAARCAQALAQKRYDAAFNFGVCGSFDAALPPGTVVHVTSECLPELGAEDDRQFLTVEQLGLMDRNHFVNAAPPGNRALSDLPIVRGITVNTVHGRESTIAAVVDRFAPQVESMEGAAFFHACSISDVPFAEVRAVSNIVERRNRAAWRMDLAIATLNQTALRILEGA